MCPPPRSTPTWPVSVLRTCIPSTIRGAEAPRVYHLKGRVERRGPFRFRILQLMRRSSCLFALLGLLAMSAGARADDTVTRLAAQLKVQVTDIHPAPVAGLYQV